jgi:Tn3 transposase DDE domain
MPPADLPDLVLEIAAKTEFLQAFTNDHEPNAQLHDVEISPRAVLVAQACNVGYRPLVDDSNPALRESRIHQPAAAGPSSTSDESAHLDAGRHHGAVPRDRDRARPAWRRFSKQRRELERSLQRSLEYQWAERDPEDNAASTPPSEERLRWHGVYVFEAYGPSHVGQLIRDVGRLGWNRERSTIDGSTLDEWIAASRGRSIAGSYYPLMLSRDGVGVGGTGVYKAPLPDGVDHARGVILNLTSAVTVVVLFFVFDDDLGLLIDRVLRKPYVSFGERVDRGWVIHTAANQRLDAAAAARRQLRNTAAGFFRDHLPGAFARDLGRDLPACEVMTAAAWRPLWQPAHDPGGRATGYGWLLGMNSDTEAWEDEHLAGFRLQLPSAMSRTPAMVLAGRHDEAFASIDGSYGGPTNAGLGSYLFMRLDGLVALWGSYELLAGYHALLSAARDVKVGVPARTSTTLSRLDRVRDELLGRAADARTIAHELDEAADAQRSSFTRLREVAFTPVCEQLWQEPDLDRTLLNSLRTEGRAVRRTEEQVRQNLTVDSGALSAAANLRLQRSVSRLTWVLIVIGIVTIALLTYQIATAK